VLTVVRGGGRFARLEGVYADTAGIGQDPPDPLVRIFDPAGVEVQMPVAPVRDGVGQFHFDYFPPADAPPGPYEARWTGTVDGVPSVASEVFLVAIVEPVPVPSDAPYGATIAGVAALLPWRTFTDSSRPTQAQVEGWLAGEIGGMVAARLGPIDDVAVPLEPLRNRLQIAARGLVHLGTAALAEAAGEPEAMEREASAYASWLWERFTEGLAALEVTVDAAVPGPGEAGVGELGEAEWSFPPPSGIGSRGL
jgi:hypothetical protein